ncbi:MAG TPA: glycosyltransferase family 39 protein [Bacillota bacterium]|nr:glycosyltransferase family 39 protein [Bacillota bacterium]
MKVTLRFSDWTKAQWQPLALYGLLVIAFGWLLWWQLGTLTGGYSGNEAQSIQASSSLKYIFHHPLNAPHTLLVNGLLHINQHNLIITRLTSVIFGLLTLSIFYWLVRYWHGQRSAFFGTLLFGTSAWFLHTARLGTPDVLLFMLLALTACAIWLKQKPGPWPLFISFVLAAGLLYVPGMIWFIGAGILWRWKSIDKIFNKQLWMVSLGALILLATLTPLGWAIFKSPDLAKQIAGLPATGWPDPWASARALLQVPVHIFFRGPFTPEHWLARIPLLDAFATAMFGLGGYLYLKHFGLARTKVLIAVLVLGAVLVALGGGVSLTVIVPFLFIMVAAGVGFMLDRWWTVFPRNIIAQSVGAGLICIAVLASCWYALRHYYVAWPNASTTRAIFVVPPSDTIKR